MATSVTKLTVTKKAYPTSKTVVTIAATSVETVVKDGRIVPEEREIDPGIFNKTD